MGLLEPINTRITDPRYFLDTPQQGRPPAPCHLLSIDSRALFESYDPRVPGFSPSGSHLTEGGKTQPPATDGKWGRGRASQRARVLQIQGQWCGLQGL